MHIYIGKLLERKFACLFKQINLTISIIQMFNYLAKLYSNRGFNITNDEINFYNNKRQICFVEI